jgi:hypothetical protein
MLREIYGRLQSWADRFSCSDRSWPGDDRLLKKIEEISGDQDVQLVDVNKAYQGGEAAAVRIQFRLSDEPVASSVRVEAGNTALLMNS